MQMKYSAERIKRAREARQKLRGSMTHFSRALWDQWLREHNERQAAVAMQLPVCK